MNTKTQDEIKAPVRAELARLTVVAEELAAQTTPEQAAADYARFVELLDLVTTGTLSDEHRAELVALSDGAGVHLRNTRDHIDRLYVTLASELMHCPARYVVTDTDQLISPAGFHASDRVFLQTAVAVHMDKLQRVPHCNVALYGHNVDVMAEA